MDDNRSQQWKSAALVVLSVLAALVGYATSVVVARRLGVEQFEKYVVATSLILLLSTLAEAGTGKYAMRLLPVLISNQHWGKAAGFWRFSLGAVLITGLLLAVVGVPFLVGEGGNLEGHPVILAVFLLPVVALAGASVDFITANQAALQGALIARVAIPLSTLLCTIVAILTVDNFDSTWALGCFGVGAVIGAALGCLVFWRVSPREVFHSAPEYELWSWLGECASYVVLAALGSWMFSINIIVLELLPVRKVEVAEFAAALQTGCLILLFSKSTDKYFQPYLSLFIESKQWQVARRMRRSRYLFVGSCCALFVLSVILWGHQILSIYGPGFEQAYPALCLCAFGASTWTMFSLAPQYLRYAAHNRFVYATMAIGCVAMAGFTVLLGAFWGATGAGLAFCVVLCTVSLTFLLKVNIELRREMAPTQQKEP